MNTVKGFAILLTAINVLVVHLFRGNKDRCSAVVRALRASAGTTDSERALLRELEKHRSCTDSLVDRVHRVTEHMRHKSNEIKKWQDEYKKKDNALGRSHSDTISSILQQQTNQLSTLIEETKLLKDQLSIV